jgi:glucosamine--fructose-6-phosphate aminotransferase (isomerizing)
LPSLIEKTLALDPVMKKLAEALSPTSTTRCSSAAACCIRSRWKGALKLKEISYIHAEAYAAGELKHGPLALVDADMPVITVAPNNDLLEKLKSNLQEVRARGGELFVFADPDSGFRIQRRGDGHHRCRSTSAYHVQAPAVYTVPLQLLAYHAPS